jgi:hypothetical protein
MWAGCSQPSNTRADELQGTPPPPSEDPFFFVAIPADAVAADTKGTIGASTVVPTESEDVKNKHLMKSAKDKALPLPNQERSRYACFSCVEICLVDNDLTQCGDKEDTICGWGVHPSRDVASDLAQVECNGALDIARESVRFARIEGSCPIATCEAQ